MLSRFLPRSHRFHCPDEHQLAAYVDQQLIGAERERVESHLAKCNSCLQQVGFLIKQSDVPEGSAPSWLVQRASVLKPAAHEPAGFGWKWASVAGVCAVTVFGLLLWRQARPNHEERTNIIATALQPSTLAIPEKDKSEGDTAVRSVSPTDSQPVVLSPLAGATVRDSDFTIRWKPIPKAAIYEVRIVNADGDLIWRKTVQENSVNAPKQTLRPGLKYFVWVRAWLPDGKTQQSVAVAFIGG